MQLRLKALTASVLLALSGSALAGISYTTASNALPGELFVNIVNSGAGVSYALDLGAPQVLGTPGTYAADPSITNSGPTSDWSHAGTLLRWDLSADTNWLAFKATNGVTAASSTFDVKALDTRTQAVDLTTVGAGDPTAQRNQQLLNFKQVAIAGLVDGVNGLPGQGVDNGSSLAHASDGQAYFVNGSGDSWKAQAVFTSTASLLDKLPFWQLSRNGSNVQNLVNALQYGSRAGDTLVSPGLWSVNYAGNYIQYEVAAVPEPGTWAMLSAGFLLIGMMARRRLS